MKKVLFIATEFPPLATAGVHRSLKFIKFLTQYDVDPIVVTLTEESSIDIFGDIVDRFLLTDIPQSTAIHRIPCKSIKPYYKNRVKRFITIYFNTNDIISKVWKKQFNKYVHNLIETEKPSIIYVTLPPFSIGNLATKIALKHKIPLIIDMRDGWLTWRTAPFGSYLHYLLTKRKERFIFNNANAIIGTTKELIEIFKKDHPKIEKNKFHWIPNGYDTELEFESVSLKKYDENKKLRIGYIGSFYYSPKGREEIFKPWWKKKGHKIFQYIAEKEDWLYRSPYFFLKTIKGITNKHSHLARYIELHFVGAKPEWMSEMLDKIDLNVNIVFHGWQKQEICQNLLSSFDAVFVTAAKRENGEDWPMPSKIFDYISANKFILSMAPPSATRNFIEKTKAGVNFNPSNLENAIHELSELILNGATLKLDKTELSHYSRLNTAKKLSKVIHNLNTFSL